MARHDIEHLAVTYATAARFIDHALREDDSLFTPGRPIWSLRNLEELDRPLLPFFMRLNSGGNGYLLANLKRALESGPVDDPSKVDQIRAD